MKGQRVREGKRKGDRLNKKEGKTRRRLRLQLAVCASGMSLLIERKREAGGKGDREREGARPRETAANGILLPLRDTFKLN